eukprot:gene7306-8500_t
MEQLTDDQRNEFNIVFQQFDKDNDGRLGPKECVMALKALGVNVPEGDVASGVDINGFLGVVVKKLQITDPEVVPDHQEIFVDEKTDQSVIIELLERQADVPDTQSVQFHYEVICEDAGITESKRTIFAQRALSSTDMPHFGATVPKYLLFGQQLVSKFNENADNTVNVYMAIVRLERSLTDLLITMYEPILLAPNSSSVAPVGSTVPSTSRPETEANFITLLQSFEIKDYSLFQNN